MAQQLGDPDALGRIAANRDVLERIVAGAIRARKPDAWNPGGWVMRTHPDMTELIEGAAPDDVRIVYGMTVLADPAGRIYAVGYGMSIIWLRVPSGPAYDDAVAGDEASAVEDLPGWVGVDGWRVDLASWVRASAALTRDLVAADA